MWNEILGALTILAMIVVGVVLIPAAPKLVDAICDRIRYGVQTPVDEFDEDPEEEAEAPAEPAAKAPAKPVAATAGKTVPAPKPATARNAA
ncbi:hypothetical protein [Amycolatopsis sp. NPDC004378]